MSEEKLIEACRRNSRKAQMQLYKNYNSAMYFVAFGLMKNDYEAEEAMQEGFITAFLKLKQYHGEATFGSWLKKIVINKCIDRLKVQNLNLLSLDENVVTTVEKDDDWEINDGVSAQEVRKEIDELPSRYRYPMMLFLIDGYDHQEISEILAISEVSSRTLVHRGKKKLQEKLKNMYHGTRY